MAPAISSSPQLAGITFANPARIHACASCTGVAGNAASTASVPRITTGTVCGTVGWFEVWAATASQYAAGRCDDDARAGVERAVPSIGSREGLNNTLKSESNPLRVKGGPDIATRYPRCGM